MHNNPNAPEQSYVIDELQEISVFGDWEAYRPYESRCWCAYRAGYRSRIKAILEASLKATMKDFCRSEPMIRNGCLPHI